MEFIILYHTLFTLQMSRRGILYAYHVSLSAVRFSAPPKTSVSATVSEALPRFRYEVIENSRYQAFYTATEIHLLPTPVL